MKHENCEKAYCGNENDCGWDVGTGGGTGGGTTGKAAIGAVCDSDAEDSGCAEGGRCSSGEAGFETCILSELCVDPTPCRAFKLGASLVAAFSLASYL